MKRRCTRCTQSALLLTALLMLGACGGSSDTTVAKETTLKTEGSPVTNKSDDTQNSYGTNASSKEDGVVASVKTNAPAEDVAASKDALFIAEGDRGVEIVRIGYNDRIDHEVLATITGINATNIALSSDQKKLYVQNREGFVNVYDVTDIKNPKKSGLYTADAIAGLKHDPITEDGRYRFVPKEGKGLYIYDISDPKKEKLAATYTQTPVYNLVLVDRGTKALAATKNSGIDLLDLSKVPEISKIGNYPLPGTVLGISVNEESGQLFIANGDQGVKVYNLNIFLDEILSQ